MFTVWNLKQSMWGHLRLQYFANLHGLCITLLTSSLNSVVGLNILVNLSMDWLGHACQSFQSRLYAKDKTHMYRLQSMKSWGQHIPIAGFPFLFALRLYIHMPSNLVAEYWIFVGTAIDLTIVIVEMSQIKFMAQLLFGYVLLCWGMLIVSYPESSVHKIAIGIVLDLTKQLATGIFIFCSSYLTMFLAQGIFSLCDLRLPIIGNYSSARCQEGNMLKPMASRWGKAIPRFSAANATPGKVMEALRVQGN